MNDYHKLKELIKTKCLDIDDILDVMGDDALKEAVEYYDSHCNCGNVLAENDDFCEECK